MKHIDTSPIQNSDLVPFITCKDHTVSGKTFSILLDRENGLLVTSPRPNDEDLVNYYESEDYISHTDSKKTLFDKAYQLARNYTTKKKIKLLNSFEISDKSLLDVGTGTGDFLANCQKKGWKVSGVEPNEKAKTIAEKKLDKTLLNKLEDFNNQTFDVITLWHVLEHVPDLNKTISMLNSLLKLNGTLVIAVPNFKSYDANHYKEFWAAYDVPRHLWHFSQNAIENLFNQTNMKVVKKLPMKFDAFYVSLLSEKYKAGRMNPFKAFWVGLRSNLKAGKTKEYSSIIYVIKKS